MTVIRTPDGVSHGAAPRENRLNAFYLQTACQTRFKSWIYAGKRYGRVDDNAPVLTIEGEIDCMTCLVKLAP